MILDFCSTVKVNFAVAWFLKVREMLTMTVHKKQVVKNTNK